MPAALNAANEVAVEAFLAGKISFPAIPKMIEKVMARHRVKKNPSLEDLLEADAWAREEAVGVILSGAALKGRLREGSRSEILRP